MQSGATELRPRPRLLEFGGPTRFRAWRIVGCRQRAVAATADAHVWLCRLNLGNGRRTCQGTGGRLGHPRPSMCWRWCGMQRGSRRKRLTRTERDIGLCVAALGTATLNERGPAKQAANVQSAFDLQDAALWEKTVASLSTVDLPSSRAPCRCGSPKTVRSATPWLEAHSPVSRGSTKNGQAWRNYTSIRAPIGIFCFQVP